MPIHNRHDFQAFPTFRRADLRATAFGQHKGCVDEALFFIEHTSFAKLIGDVGRNVPQHRREMAHAAAALSKLQNAVHRRFQSWCRNEVKPGTGRVLVEVDPRYFRQTEVDDLVDDPSKTRRQLGWQHRVSFNELVEQMVKQDLMLAKHQPAGLALSSRHLSVPPATWSCQAHALACKTVLPSDLK
jgi:GDP-mannose 4,6 dehydratase